MLPYAPEAQACLLKVCLCFYRWPYCSQLGDAHAIMLRTIYCLVLQGFGYYSSVHNIG